MNRLTRVEGLSTLIKDGWKKKDTEKNYTSICYGCEEIRKCVNKCGFYKALEKLAAYEDTGFEPKEIKEALEKKIKPKEKPKSKLLFILTMPNVGSWNGKWTGADRAYARVRNAKQYPNCKEDNYYYSFGDGWGANVEVKKVTVVEANKYIKKSAGFSGYDWMIDSILLYGQILNSKERQEYLKKQVSEVENE